MQFSPEDEGFKLSKDFPFKVFCNFLEKFTLLKGTNKKKEALKTFIDAWKVRYNRQLNKNTQISAGLGSFYPVLRLLIPSADRARSAYGIGESVMARLFIKSFGLAPKGLDARNLQNCHNSRVTGHTGNVDLADVVFTVLQDRCVITNTLSLADIHEELDALAAAATEAEKTDILCILIRKATILELKWFVRLVSRRDMSLGLGTSAVLSCLHPAAPAVWCSTQDLCGVCQKVASIDPSEVHLSTTKNLSQSVELFVAFKPMLCERANSVEDICLSFQKTWSATVDCRLCLELKYDGERVQLHKSGSSYRFFSRQGRPWTSSYGDSSDVSAEGSLTPRLHGAFARHATEFILDGEMMGFDSYEESFVTKSTGYDVKRSVRKENPLFLSKAESSRSFQNSQTQPCFIAFDILYLNGELLTEKPLWQRKELLLTVFPALQSSCNQVSDMVENCFKTENSTDDTTFDQACRLLSLFPIVNEALYLGGFMFTSADESVLARYFDTWIDNGAEGLVAKATTTTYVPGGRSGCGWWKLKPDYVLGLSSDLDCLVVGAYVKSASSTSTTTNSGEPLFTQFLCAVMDGGVAEGATIIPDKKARRDDDDDDDLESLPEFLTFCQVTNGLTRNQLVAINRQLRPHWRPYNRRRREAETEWLRVSAERPDVWIPPRHSIVFEIHAAEMTTSASYAAGMTLRFPRVTAIRDDKTWQDVATLAEIRRLKETTGGNLVTRRLRLGSDDEAEEDAKEDVHWPDPGSPGHKTTKRLAANRTKPRDSIHPPRETVQIDSAEVKSSAFENTEFCLVLSSQFNGPTSTLATKSDLEREILKLSGRVVQNPGPNTAYVVADRVFVKVDTLIKATREGKARGREGGYDIVKCDWLLRCLRLGHLVGLSEDLVFAVRPSTKLSKHQSTDDTLTAWLSSTIKPDFLRDEIFPQMTTEDDADVVIERLSDHEYAQLLGDQFSEFAKPLFGANVLLLGPATNQINLIKADLLRLQASVCGPFKTIDDAVTGLLGKPTLTHIVLTNESQLLGNNSSASSTPKAGLQRLICAQTGQKKVPCLVNLTWTTDCISQGAWLPEAPYSF